MKSTTPSGSSRPSIPPRTGVSAPMASIASTVSTMPTRPPSSTLIKRSLMSPSIVKSMILLRKTSQLYSNSMAWKKALAIRIHATIIRRK